MFTGWPGENSMMNQGSMHWADAGCLGPADDDHSQDDLQLLLESPTALAAQYNYFSANLSGDLGYNQDPLRQNSLVGSPDFSRQLNMAGMFDAAADTEQHHIHPRLLSLQLAGSFQPDSLLLPSSQEPQQASSSMPAPHGGAAAAPYQNTEAHQTYDMYQILQQRQQQRYAVQNALHNHQRAPSMGWMVQLPAASTFRLPGIVMPQQNNAQDEGPMLQLYIGQQQQQQVSPTVHMPAAEELPVSSAPKKKRAIASLANVLRPVAVPVFGESLPKVPVVTYAEAADEKQAPQGGDQQQRQTLQPEVKEAQRQQQQLLQQQQQQQQPEPMNLRRRAKQQQVQKQVQKQPVQRQPGKQQPQPTGRAAAALPAGHVAMVSTPVSGAQSGSTDAAQSRASQATTSTAAPGVSMAVGLGKGTLVWAKFPRFPWWPAIIVSDAAAAVGGHSTSSSGTSTAAAANTLVRFLGTYDAAWVEPKAVSRWGVSQHERTSKTKAAAFTKALKEAASYLNTGELPEEFQEPPQLTQAPPPAGKHKKGKQPLAEDTTTAAAAELLQQHPDVWSLVPKVAHAAASSSPAVSHAHQPTAVAAAPALLQQQPQHAGDGDHHEAVLQGHVPAASAAHSSNTSSSSGDSKPPAAKSIPAAKRKAAQRASKSKRSKTGR